MVENKIKRNKFFLTAGTGIAGFILLKSFSLNLFVKGLDLTKKKVSVKLNPDAVSRNKAGRING
jgi:hypothetical protein